MKIFVLILFCFELLQSKCQLILHKESKTKIQLSFDHEGMPYYEKEYLSDSLVNINYIDLNGNKRKVYTYVDEMPTIDNTPIYKFVNERVIWPTDNDGQGLVLISIIVEINGECSNIRIIKGINASINQEAIKAVKKIPNLKPGIMKGQAVATEVFIPVYYK